MTIKRKHSKVTTINVGIEEVKRQQNTSGLQALAPISSMQYENVHRELTLEEMKAINHYRAIDGGYQRSLSLTRVANIREDLKKRGVKTSDYPEIVIANINGKLQCVDGQHRLMGHIEAGVCVFAHIQSMTQAEAVQRFVRDNALAKPLKRKDLIAASNNPLATQIRAIAKGFDMSQMQAAAFVSGLINKSTLPIHDPGFELDERQQHAVTTALNIWTKDKRWRNKLPADILNLKSRREFKERPECAFSGVLACWLVGKICHRNIHNLNKVLSEVKMLRDADWIKKNLGSLRTLASGYSSEHKGELLEYFDRKVLLPAYKDKLN
jgi:hypothetical protein